MWNKDYKKNFKDVLILEYFNEKFILSFISVALTNPKSAAAQQVLDIVNNPNLYNKDIPPYPNRSGKI